MNKELEEYEKEERDDAPAEKTWEQEREEYFNSQRGFV